MTFDEAKQTLKILTYKPGFIIELNHSFGSFPELCTLTISQENVPGNKEVRLYVADMDRSTFVHRVFNELLNWERHEAGEFFRYDGVKIFNPHTDVDLLKFANEERRKND
jgi:hypothetical protein